MYKGTVFDLVDQAVDFVLSKINLAVGTREHSTQAPVAYEMPPEVVREAIVNAVAHRDYTSNGSVQVMLFSDRLEVWNPGTLPPSLTLEKLRQPHASVAGNPLLAEPLCLTKYIERMSPAFGWNARQRLFGKGEIGDVERAIFCRSTRRPNFRGEFFKTIGAARPEHDPMPFGRKMTGRGLADSTARASDENDFAVDVRFMLFVRFS